jgi:nicotinamide-nucleotide amidase
MHSPIRDTPTRDAPLEEAQQRLTSRPDDDETRARLAERVGEVARRQHLTVAVAESLTGGMISTELAAAGGSSDWFLGGLVAYASAVKHAVLDVPEGPVVNAPAAGAMARGVRRLLRADVGLAVTGAAGPDGQDGQEPGTVFVAFTSGDQHRELRLQLDGEPPAVCRGTTAAALRMLVECLEARGAGRS